MTKCDGGNHGSCKHLPEEHHNWGLSAGQRAAMKIADPAKSMTAYKRALFARLGWKPLAAPTTIPRGRLPPAEPHTVGADCGFGLWNGSYHKEARR